MINISPEYLEMIRRILTAHVCDCEVRAFGSRINGTAKDHSDLDLAVVASDKMERRTKMLVKEAFEESDLPFRVDIVDYNAISDEFRAIIDTKYEILQQKK
jgi:predicted nucleotidyltransferase